MSLEGGGSKKGEHHNSKTTARNPTDNENENPYTKKKEKHAGKRKKYVNRGC